MMQFAARLPLRHRDALMRLEHGAFTGASRVVPLGPTIEGGDMVTDAALWFILVAMIVWIVCGCYVTRPDPARQPPGQIDAASTHPGFDE